MSLTPCCQPGCGVAVEGRFCEAHAKGHRKAHDAKRGTSTERGYGKPWRRQRKLALMRDHYQCQACGKPTGESGHVDHIKPRPRGAPYNAREWDRLDNLQTLCERCHNRKTAREDGGFGHG